MDIELHHLHPSHDDELSRLKERIAELEKENESLKYSVATLETDLAMIQRWRKCSEELPTKDDANESGKLLGYLSGYGIAHEYHWTDVRDKLYGITHWMPIPSAPKEEK